MMLSVTGDRERKGTCGHYGIPVKSYTLTLLSHPA